MGIKKKWVPGGTCCCLPQASDGNIYSDTFDSLDADWTVSDPTEFSFSATGGFGIFNQNAAFSGPSPRIMRPTETVGSMTDLLMIIEANTYRLAGTATVGIYVGWSLDGSIRFGLNMRLTAVAPNEINAIFHGANNFIAYTPTDGDKLAIKFKYNTRTTNVDVCYFVDDDLVYQNTTGAANFSDPTPYGLYATQGGGGGGLPKDIGKWDNFSFHLSH